MARRNYVRYSKMNNEESNEVVLDKPSYEEVVDEVVEEVVEEVVAKVKQPEPIPAVVAGCAKLRVRKAPDANADTYGTIDEGTELTIDAEAANEEFYKVYTIINDTLIEGYCMKKFIKLK